ncbi:MAG: hypothetical protein RJQ04_03115 [Longimicrobiales bacterium]
MGMFEKAAKSRPQDPPSRREMMRDQSSEAWARARARFQIASLAYHSEGSWRSKRKAIATSIKAGTIASTVVPSVSKIQRLQAKYERGLRSIGDYYDRPRSGRPEKHLDLVFRTFIQQAVDEASEKSDRQIHRECRKLAIARGYQPPTRHQVRKELKRAYRLKYAAGRHGSRAAEIDGLPHCRIFSLYKDGNDLTVAPSGASFG